MKSNFKYKVICLTSIFILVRYYIKGTVQYIQDGEYSLIIIYSVLTYIAVTQLYSLLKDFCKYDEPGPILKVNFAKIFSIIGSHLELIIMIALLICLDIYAIGGDSGASIAEKVVIIILSILAIGIMINNAWEYEWDVPNDSDQHFLFSFYQVLIIDHWKPYFNSYDTKEHQLWM